MLKKTFVYLIFIFFIIACRPIYTVGCGGELFGETVIGLKVQNKLGENLLDKTNPNYINTDSVFLYRVSKDGCEILIYAKFNDNSKGFGVSGTGKNTVMGISLTGNGIALYHYHGTTEIKDEDFPNCTLLIKWNLQNTDTDTIFSTFIKKNPWDPNSICKWDYFDKVYVNSKLLVSSWEDYKEKREKRKLPVIIK